MSTALNKKYPDDPELEFKSIELTQEYHTNIITFNNELNIFENCKKPNIDLFMTLNWKEFKNEDNGSILVYIGQYDPVKNEPIGLVKFINEDGKLYKGEFKE